MSEDWIMNIAFATFALLVLTLVGMAGFGLWASINYLFLPVRTTAGVVAEINFVAQHREYQFNAALKMVTPHTVPDRWYLRIQTPKGSGPLMLDHPPWAWEAQGQPVNVRYSMTRWGRAFSLVEISQP